MKLILISLLIAVMAQTSSIYDFTINSADGTSISLNNFRGKKILIVNIATGSENASQIGQLQQLKQQFGDSLVIIGFPSYSFGHEPRRNSEILEYCQSQYNVTYYLSSSGSVTGANPQPVYAWLTRKSENGSFGSVVKEDFQKYIINENGDLVGVFAGSVSPLDSQIISTLNGSSN